MNEDFLNAFIDSYVENDCLEEALKLKWLSLEMKG